MLAEKILKDKLPGAHPVRMLAGKSQGFTLYRRPRSCCHIRHSRQHAGPRPSGEGEDGREEPTVKLHTCLDGEVIEEIRDILEWGGGSVCEDHQFSGCGFSGRGFHTRACFLICLHSCRPSGCSRLYLGLLRPIHLPGGGHFRLRGRPRNRLRSGFRIWWSGGGLDNKPSSDDVTPALAQVRLFRRGPVPLGFRSAGLACGDVFPDNFWRSLCKCLLRFFPLNPLETKLIILEENFFSPF